MIPAAFDYVRASSVAEAISLLGEHGDEAKLIAGGHSLLPLMKLRLATPAVLIDVSRIPELSSIADGGDHLLVGALARHHDVATNPLVRSAVPVLAAGAAAIGDPQVRHRGTIGGSLAHGDPASDLPAVVLALGATMVLQGPGGERTVAASDFFTGFLETAVGPDEIITAIRVPKAAAGSFQKFVRRAQDWAIVGAAVAVGDSGVGVGLVNMASTPVRATAVEAALAAGAPAADAAEHAADDLDPPADLNATAEYRRHLARVLVRRGLEEAGVS